MQLRTEGFAMQRDARKTAPALPGAPDLKSFVSGSKLWSLLVDTLHVMVRTILGTPRHPINLTTYHMRVSQNMGTIRDLLYR